MAEPDLRAEAKANVRRFTAEFLALVDRAWAQLADAQAALLRDYPTLNGRERAQREAHLERLASQLADDVVGAAKVQISTALTGAFTVGAQRTLAVAAGDLLDVADSDLLRSAIAETYADILTATKYVKSTTKELIRLLAREAATARVAGAGTAEEQAAALAKQIEGRGIAAIVYKDGSRHGLADYADMLLRTKTAEIYQQGGFAQAASSGVEWMEILDNPSCGLSFHNDPILANGMILPLSEAEKYPISHPRCVRVTVARPDILTKEQAARAEKSTTAAQDADQAVVEQTRLSAAQKRAETRATRNRSGRLNVNAGAALSPAARRAAARVARRRPGST